MTAIEQHRLSARPTADFTPDAPEAAAAERQAVERTLSGDPGAFQPIVERYTPLLYSLASRLLGPGDEIEDAVQEIFERLYRNLPRYDPARSFHPWMYTVALNHLRSLRRRQQGRRSARVFTEDPALLDTRPAGQGEWAGGERPADPAQRAALVEGERLAALALAELPPRQREVFVLRQLEGLSVRDTAQALRLPEGTVKTLLHRARRRLAERLAREGWP